MSGAVKFGDLIKPYSGDDDFAEWIKKFELVAKLQKVTDLASYLPLFLHSGAFSVYENLDEDVKANYTKLKKMMIKILLREPIFCI